MFTAQLLPSNFGNPSGSNRALFVIYTSCIPREILLYPTDLFTTLELKNPSHEAPELNKIVQYSDLAAPKIV